MPKQKSVLTLMYRQLVRWFVKKGWPWILKNIWPLIQEQLLQIFTQAINSFVERILEWFTKEKANQEEAARHNAETAEKHAQSAKDQAEAEKYRAVADVWREVAETFRQENETLKEKLDYFKKKSVSESEQDLHSLKLDDIVEEGDSGTIRLKGTQTALQLPMPNSE